MKAAWIIALAFSAVLSFVEASSFLDSHHDILVFLNSLFIYEGLVPYRDFYVQYGILQPLLTATFFHIFGVNLFSQNLLIIIAFSIFNIYNYKIILLITKNVQLSSLCAILLIAVEPFIILPWPNFLIGCLSAISLYYVLKYFFERDVNALFIGNLVAMLVPFARSNAGLLYSIFVFCLTLIVCLKRGGTVYWLKLLCTSAVGIAYFALYASEDFVRQSFVLPTDFLLPYGFNLPNDPISLLKLHFQLFFREQNLVSIVSTNQALWFWRYVLELSIIFMFFKVISFSISSYRSRTLMLTPQVSAFVVLFICGISASSSVFPIFDSFRAINAWFPLLTLLIYGFYGQGSSIHRVRLLRVFVGSTVVVFCGANFLSSNVSIVKLISNFDVRSILFQFVDLRKFREITTHRDFINMSGGLDFSSKAFVSALDINPFVKYTNLRNELAEKCGNSYFYSNSMDFTVYLLHDYSYRWLPHKMFMSQSLISKGNFIDVNSMLYSDFYESFNRRESLCLFLSKRTSKYWIDNLRDFSGSSDYGDHILYYR